MPAPTRLRAVLPSWTTKEIKKLAEGLIKQYLLLSHPEVFDKDLKHEVWSGCSAFAFHVQP